jgi:predicted dehydrogenase
VPQAARVGIIGVGWGTIAHVPAFRAVAGFEVAALCSRTPESAAAAAARTGIDDVGTDWKSFVQRDDLDVIVVASPPGMHAEMTIASLEQGKHVLCEKPFGASVADAQAMAAAAEASDRASAVCFELRWTRERERVLQLVRGGLVGTPYFVRLHQSWSDSHPVTGKEYGEWFYQRAQHGGWLSQLSVHDVDFLITLFGTPVRVLAELAVSIPRRTLRSGQVVPVDTEDSAVVTFRLADGGLGCLSVSAMAVDQSGYTFDAFGSAGTITVQAGLPIGPDMPWPEENVVIHAATTGDKKMNPVPLSDRTARSGFAFPARRARLMMRAEALMLEDWLPALSGSPAAAPSFRDGLRAQHVLDAILRSAREGSWVDLEVPG